MEQQFCQICQIFITKKNFARHSAQAGHIHKLMRWKNITHQPSVQLNNNINEQGTFSNKYKII